MAAVKSLSAVAILGLGANGLPASLWSVGSYATELSES